MPALALLLFAPDRATQPAVTISLALLSALLAGLMARTGYDLFVMMGVTEPAIVAPFILLALLALVPFLWLLRALSRIGALFAVAGLILCTVAAIRGQTPSAASPELAEAFRIVDVDTGNAMWVSGKPD